MKTFEQIVGILTKRELSKDCFFRLLCACEELNDFEINSLEDLKCLGLDVEEVDGGLRLMSRYKKWQEQKFCIVDIETNNLPLNDARVIEIGAVILQNGAILDEFHSLIFTDTLPEAIVKLTGITPKMLENAPSEASVLERFRLFLGESIFVAHNVDFDFSFLLRSLKRHGCAPLLNRTLCTIKLAKKTIKSPKYGLQTMRDILGITNGVLHRAMDDAKSAAEVFKAACKNLPKSVVTTENLIDFSKSNKQFFQPHFVFEECK